MQFHFSVNLNGNSWNWSTNRPTNRQAESVDPNLQSLFADLHASSGPEFLTELMLRQALQASEQTGPTGPEPCPQATLDKLETHTLRKEHSTIGHSCSICLEDFTEGTSACKLPCGHTFHPACVKHWLEQHNSCPACRKALPTDAGGPSGPASIPSTTADAGGSTAGSGSLETEEASGSAWSNLAAWGAELLGWPFQTNQPTGDRPTRDQSARGGAEHSTGAGDESARDESAPQHYDVPPLQHEVGTWREMRNDAARMSVRELRVTINDLGGDTTNCLEKSELINAYLAALGCDLSTISILSDEHSNLLRAEEHTSGRVSDQPATSTSNIAPENLPTVPSTTECTPTLSTATAAFELEPTGADVFSCDGSTSDQQMCSLICRFPDGTRHECSCRPMDTLQSVMKDINIAPPIELCTPTGQLLDPSKTVGELDLSNAVVCVRAVHPG